MKIGCNYWASHAGTETWRRWDENVVREDFRRLAEIGCNMVRVFPNWRDFQPIEIIRGCLGKGERIRFRGENLPDTPCGRAGVDEEMIRRFRVLAEIAAENKIDLIVGIMTGWMSGTLFVPPALEGLNLFYDPLALKWQTRFIRCFVRELKDCPAIKYWELGNECNCMSPCPDSAAAWNWTNMVTSAIRMEDPSRPVSSGMHGLMPMADDPDHSGRWSLQDQGELCDLLTPHPYPHSPSKVSARVDAHNSIRCFMQASVEMLLFSDIGGRPGSVEEIGTFAPSYCAEKEKAEFLRCSIMNSWAHGAESFLWWCAFDQSQLDFPPYEHCAWERELGLFRADFSRKPVADVIGEFREFERKLPFAELPPFRRNAVCVITKEQNFDTVLQNAWSTFILSKQCGFDIRYNYCMDGDPGSGLYLVPGVTGPCGLEKGPYMKLLDRAREGATVYFSMDSAAFSPFEEVFGVETAGREARTEPAEFTFEGCTFKVNSPYRLYLRSIGAEVLACEKNGNPVFVRHRYGKGMVYLLTLPLEKDLAARPGVFAPESARKLRKIYQVFAGPALAERHLFTEDPLISLTEHFDGSTWWCVAVNNGPEEKTPRFTAAEGWQIETQVSQMKPGTAVVIRITRKRENSQEKSE